MACETCDHTMQKCAGDPVFWCPRCGRLKIVNCGAPNYESVPMVVERARRLAQGVIEIQAYPGLKGLARDVLESVLPPDKRG
jgi:hypothetical protein